MKNEDKKRILIIEDESHIAEGLKLNLNMHGYNVSIAPDGVTALSQWKEFKPHLIVLDIMLPGIDGISVLRSIRLVDQRIPVLVLSAKGTPDDKIKGLKYGVDDYMVKPFVLEEFILRVKRLIEKSTWFDGKEDLNESRVSSVKGEFRFGDNVINFTDSTALCSDKKITLTEQETKLLKLFITNPGKPLSRQKLLEMGWGYTKGMTTRTVDNFIVRLRKYFEKNPKKPDYFKSCRSVGYMFDFEEPDAKKS